MTALAGLGVALLGTGAAARDHVRALKAMALPPPSWIVGRSADQARSFAFETGVAESSDDLRAALEDPGVDIVVIATPSPQHGEQALAAIAAGKHVLVEIPFAMSGPEAEAVARAAAQSGMRVFACHPMRASPAIREVRRRVVAGDLEVSAVSGFFAIPRRNNEGRTGPRNWVDSLLWHHACHQVDAAMWVLGVTTLDRISAVAGPPHARFGMALDLGIVGATDRHQLITQALTYNASVPEWLLRFQGDRDSLRFRNGGLFDEGGAPVVPATLVTDFRWVWEIVLKALATGAESDLDVEAIIPTMRVLQRAEDSMAPAR